MSNTAFYLSHFLSQPQKNHQAPFDFDSKVIQQQQTKKSSFLLDAQWNVSLLLGQADLGFDAFDVELCRGSDSRLRILSCCVCRGASMPVQDFPPCMVTDSRYRQAPFYSAYFLFYMYRIHRSKARAQVWICSCATACLYRPPPYGVHQIFL